MKALWIFLMVINQEVAVAQTGFIEVTVKNLKSDQGYLAVSLFNKEKSEGFPAASENAVRTAYVKIPEGEREPKVLFENLPFGIYGLSVMHDSDGDKKLKTFLGIPREGFGFSKNPRVLFGPPTFDKVSFDLKSEKVTAEVKMVYFL